MNYTQLMMPNYTPFEVAVLEKSYGKKKLSTVLISIILILTLVVSGLVGYLLYVQM